MQSIFFQTKANHEKTMFGICLTYLANETGNGITLKDRTPCEKWKASLTDGEMAARIKAAAIEEALFRYAELDDEAYGSLTDPEKAAIRTAFEKFQKTFMLEF